MANEQTRLQIIKEVIGRGARPPHETIVGVDEQDDAAVVRLANGEFLIIASDFIRGSGFYLFELGYLNYYDVGYYLVVANLSDIAAMGCLPIGLTSVVRYGPAMTDGDFREVFNGMKAAADSYGVEIVGGDTGSYVADVFVATAFGISENGRVLLRSGASIGDLVCVIGDLGLPIAALAYFKKAKDAGLKLSSELENRLLRSWKRPSAKIKEGQILSRYQIATACQDISDGLKATIQQLSFRSGIGITIREELLPIDPVVTAVADFLQISPIRLLMSASVDFALLFTMAKESFSQCSSLFSEYGMTFKIIGEVNAGGINQLALRDGTIVPIPGTEWNHQPGDLIEQVLKS